MLQKAKLEPNWAVYQCFVVFSFLLSRLEIVHGIRLTLDCLQEPWLVLSKKQTPWSSVILLISTPTPTPQCCLYLEMQRNTGKALLASLFSGLLIGAGCALYPLGWDSEEIRQTCGYVSGQFDLGKFSSLMALLLEKNLIWPLIEAESRRDMRKRTIQPAVTCNNTQTFIYLFV